MTNPTKGPWMVDDTFKSEVQTENNESIASCWHEHAEGVTIEITGVLACSLEESAANAHLIAAAPDMLEALKAMVTAEVDYMTINKLGDPEKQHNVKIARAAIAKAEGKA